MTLIQTSGPELLRMRIPNIPTSVTILMAVIVFTAPLVVMLVLPASR